MYLTNENNKIIISDYESLISRLVRQVILLTEGFEDLNTIVFDFEEKKVINLIEFLQKNNIGYLVDNFLDSFLQKHFGKIEDFKFHTIQALEIKNNLNNASRGYVDFINVIKKKMVRSLYEHQLKAAYHMAFSLNSCNFSVPGSGKTTIVYTAYSYLKDLGKVEKLLIVGPLSSSLAWKNEYYACFNKIPNFINLNELNQHEKTKYFKKYKDIQSEINFINYEAFNNIKKPLNEFLDKNSVMVVLDEAHKIKNPNAKRSRSIMSFADKAKSRIILTGTPIPNGYIDLYNLFEFVWPDKNIIGFNPNQLKKISESFKYESDVKRLMNNIDPYYIRITKDVLNLPKPTFNDPINVEMGEIQRKIYDFIADDFLELDYSGGDFDLQMDLKKAKLIRLMQSLTNPSTLCQSINRNEYDDSELFNLICNYENLEIPKKYSTVFNLVQDIVSSNGKVIVWTQFVHNLKGLKQFLLSNNISSELLYGEIDNEERESIINRFHSDMNLKVIIANPAAVAESISLHKACHNAIYMDMSFNAAHYMQSKDRIHRVGLNPDDETNYYFLLCKESIDEIIYKRVLEKEEVMLNIIEGKTVPLFSKDFEADLSDTDINIVYEYLLKERLK